MSEEPLVSRWRPGRSHPTREGTSFLQGSPSGASRTSWHLRPRRTKASGNRGHSAGERWARERTDTQSPWPLTRRQEDAGPAQQGHRTRTSQVPKGRCPPTGLPRPAFGEDGECFPNRVGKTCPGSRSLSRPPGCSLAHAPKGPRSAPTRPAAPPSGEAAPLQSHVL